VHRRLVDIRLWIGSDDQVQADLIPSPLPASALPDILKSGGARTQRVSEQGNARRAPMNCIATARAHCFDLAATAFLFVSASVMAGRIWRFPFDDEIATLSKIEPGAAREFVANFPATDDIHPPFSYVFFYATALPSSLRCASQLKTRIWQSASGLRQLGCSGASMRLCQPATDFPSSRIIAVLTFGLMPLALSQGDALRWYPVFAVLIVLFIVLYLVPRRQSQCLWSAAALGLAASTDFSAALIVPPFLLYRHVLQPSISLVV
jgi:hypothetical protein